MLLSCFLLVLGRSRGEYAAIALQLVHERFVEKDGWLGSTSRSLRRRTPFGLPTLRCCPPSTSRGALKGARRVQGGRLLRLGERGAGHVAGGQPPAEHAGRSCLWCAVVRSFYLKDQVKGEFEKIQERNRNGSVCATRLVTCRSQAKWVPRAELETSTPGYSEHYRGLEVGSRESPLFRRRSCRPSLRSSLRTPLPTRTTSRAYNRAPFFFFPP